MSKASPAELDLALVVKQRRLAPKYQVALKIQSLACLMYPTPDGQIGEPLRARYWLWQLNVEERRRSSRLPLERRLDSLGIVHLINSGRWLSDDAKGGTKMGSGQGPSARIVYSKGT